MIKIIPILFLVLSFDLAARSPAVEPVMGISIEELNHVPPEQAVGFDFSQPENVSRSPAIEVPVSYDFLAPTSRANNFENESRVPYTLIGLLLILPFIIWFGVLKNIDQSYSSQKVLKNTFSLKDARNKRESQRSEDQDNFPKAS